MRSRVDVAPATAPDAQRRVDEQVAALHARAYRPMVGLAVVLTDSPALAEEIVQEAFVRVLGRWRRIRDLDAAEAYLRTAVVNLCRDSWRRERLARRLPPPTDPDRVTPSTEERAVVSDEHRRVLAAIDTLPARQREVVALRYFSGLTEIQVADALGIGLGTVKSYHHRAIAALRQELEP